MNQINCVVDKGKLCKRVMHIYIQDEENISRYGFFTDNPSCRSGMTREEETSNIEHVLQHHRQMHDELTTDLTRMAQQLKANSQSFGDTLANDDKV